MHEERGQAARAHSFADYHALNDTVSWPIGDFPEQG